MSRKLNSFRACSTSTEFYAVARGAEIGIFTCWIDVNPLVTKIKNSKHKKFKSYQDAERWMELNCSTADFLRWQTFKSSAVPSMSKESSDLFRSPKKQKDMEARIAVDSSFIQIAACSSSSGISNESLPQAGECRSAATASTSSSSNANGGLHHAPEKQARVRPRRVKNAEGQENSSIPSKLAAACNSEFTVINLPEDLPDKQNQDSTVHTTVHTMAKMTRLEFDGGSRGNPGVGGFGALLWEMGNSEKLMHILCGTCTLPISNNEAEYMGVLHGMEVAKQYNYMSLQLVGDSQLILHQISGKYRVSSDRLRPLHERVMKLKDHNFKDVSMKHVLRHLNKHADAIANVAQDAHLLATWLMEKMENNRPEPYIPQEQLSEFQKWLKMETPSLDLPSMLLRELPRLDHHHPSTITKWLCKKRSHGSANDACVSVRSDTRLDVGNRNDAVELSRDRSVIEELNLTVAIDGELFAYQLSAAIARISGSDTDIAEDQELLLTVLAVLTHALMRKRVVS
ncbi:hypothetical protein CEUSTIGMA_g118.t1 [Chlamydomonas eustigma]|uniref:RNase H type-1 domain-containing protein n=1 Tax=Chlamydomonas eustigma TaxID=1157962 RepID=A0A250WPS8_9CHLO|nr:hypothetical protein CEUSTIGMA_g118.t1 [Chlamydomonas eustigma]|eukprot:GAX72662.1 hypothetical protein CEUSTIGMA_g118.t1 [Chlamydomonas eustigma]